MTNSRLFQKYVSENRAFAIDWTNALSNANNGAADTLATSVWQEDTGITVVTSSTSGNVTRVRLSGGTGGNTYRIENTVTLTTSGYTRMEYIQVKVNFDPVP